MQNDINRVSDSALSLDNRLPILLHFDIEEANKCQFIAVGSILSVKCQWCMFDLLSIKNVADARLLSATEIHNRNTYLSANS